MAKYHVMTIANEFIKRSASTGITHMKLQKLVYLAHEDWVKRGGEPFLQENPQVWQYGPVFSSLYHELKHYKKRCINKPLALPDTQPSVAQEDAHIIKTIDKIWSEYGEKSDVYLSDITHQPGTPWQNLAKAYNFSVPYGLEIKPDDIYG